MSMMYRTPICSLVLVLAAVIVQAPACIAAPTSRVDPAPPSSIRPSTNDADGKLLSELEQTYFQRLYAQDPPEKRLRRLELFLTGQSEFGTVPQRIALLKEYLKHKRPPEVKDGAGAINVELSQLEQRILKKNFPNSDQNSRIAALEKKVFGAAFPTISTKARIGRLKKTIGIGESDVAQVPPGFRSYHFERRFHLDPNKPFGMPFGESNGFSNDPEINRQMSEMFKQLNQQLRDLQNTPRGFSQPYNFLPDQDEHEMPLQPSPVRPPAPHLPPYMDPNSI